MSKATRIKKFVVAGDLHGDMQDKNTVRAFLRFVDDFNPDIRIANGDIWDYAALRRGVSESDREEGGKSTKPDFRAGEVFLNQFFHPRAENVYMGGNHCLERLERLARSTNAIVSDFAQAGLDETHALFRRLKAKYYPWNKSVYYLLGDSKVLHGFSSGMYITKKMAETYGNCLFSHTHSRTEYRAPSIEKRHAYNIGCLCKLDMEYNKAHMACFRQEHSWAYGIILPNQTTITHLAQEYEEGKFYVSEGFKEVR